RRRQLEEALEDSLGRGDIQVRQVIVQGGAVEFPFPAGEQQQGFHVGRKGELCADLRIIERLQADAVAGSEQGTLLLIPNSERKHSAQFLEPVSSPGDVGLQQGFGIRARAKPHASAFQLAPQLLEVVDLAVKDNCVAPIRRGHGLLARRKVNDAQPAVTQGEALVPIVALAIRPAMRQCARHCTDQVVVSLSDESSYATHRLLSSTTYARESAGTNPADLEPSGASSAAQTGVALGASHRRSRPA